MTGYDLVAIVNLLEDRNNVVDLINYQNTDLLACL